MKVFAIASVEQNEIDKYAQGSALEVTEFTLAVPAVQCSVIASFT